MYKGIVMSALISDKVVRRFGADNKYIQDLPKHLNKLFLSLKSNGTLRHNFGEHIVYKLAARVYQDTQQSCQSIVSQFGMADENLQKKIGILFNNANTYRIDTNVAKLGDNQPSKYLLSHVLNESRRYPAF